MNILDGKAQLRSYIKEQRALLTEDIKQELDDKLLKQLLTWIQELPELKEKPSIPVYCYMSVRGEADTLRFVEALWSRGILPAVPRVEGKFIRFYGIEKMSDLIPGCMGIPEPAPECIPVDCPEAPVITPGLAFSPDGARIGYGGGFYDRFFEAEPKHRRVALAYGFQVLPDIPYEPFDKRIDMIITENRVYHCSQRIAGRLQED